MCESADVATGKKTDVDADIRILTIVLSHASGLISGV